MLFDPVTLTLLTVVMAVTIGLLLLMSWAQNRDYSSLALWGAGNIVGAIGAALLMARNIAPDFLSINVGNAVLFGGYALMWAGSRAFGDRPIVVKWLVAGPAMWLIACAFPAFYQSGSLRVVLASATVTAYTLATARELWISNGERLISRYPAVIWLTLHALLYTGRLGATLFWTVPSGAQLPETLWFALITYESLIHVTVVGFLFLSMTKERSEWLQRHAASTDELTGVMSRRAFLSEGEKKLRSAVTQGLPVTLLLLDLDHFKSINDNHGHDAGDRVLRAFSQRARQVLRPCDLFGRVGGEEFAALLADTGAETGLAVAERFRQAVEETELRENGEPIELSVSIGVATDFGPGARLGDMMAQADRALYAAKAAGRNRVHQRKQRAEPLLRAV